MSDDFEEMPTESDDDICPECGELKYAWSIDANGMCPECCERYQEMIRRGEEDIEAGRVHDHKDVRREILGDE